jgi:hypothetical protein
MSDKDKDIEILPVKKQKSILLGYNHIRLYLFVETKWGLMPSYSPDMMNSAAPDGAPPRRINQFNAKIM